MCFYLYLFNVSNQHQNYSLDSELTTQLKDHALESFKQKNFNELQTQLQNIGIKVAAVSNGNISTSPSKSLADTTSKLKQNAKNQNQLKGIPEPEKQQQPQLKAVSQIAQQHKINKNNEGFIQKAIQTPLNNINTKSIVQEGQKQTNISQQEVNQSVEQSRAAISSQQKLKQNLNLFTQLKQEMDQKIQKNQQNIKLANQLHQQQQIQSNQQKQQQENILLQKQLITNKINPQSTSTIPKSSLNLAYKPISQLSSQINKGTTLSKSQEKNIKPNLQQLHSNNSIKTGQLHNILSIQPNVNMKKSNLITNVNKIQQQAIMKQQNVIQTKDNNNELKKNQKF